MKNNILICSAGKRVSLVKIFKEVVNVNQLDLKIFTTDMNPSMAPAVWVSDGGFAVPKVTDPNYCDILIEICNKFSIGLVIPTIDTELLVLSQNKSLFQDLGINVVVSSVDFVSMCRDKRKTNSLFESLNMRVPRQIDINRPVFPIFAKPYDGSLSKDIHLISSIDQLTQNLVTNPKLMFMEYINPEFYKEYTVDLYYSRDHVLKGIVPRERIDVRAGEINKGRAVKNYIIKYIKKHLNILNGVVGCICVQLFYNSNDQDIIAIEINPRFGGGYPLSYYAGANYPLYLIQEYLLGVEVNYDESWEDGTVMLRYDAEIILNKENICKF